MGVASGSALAGAAVLVLAGGAGALWLRDEAPVLPYCFAVQWIFATTGYLVWLATGRFPGMEPAGDVETAVALSLAGLAAVAVGLRLGLHAAGKWLDEPAGGERLERLDVGRLFWVVAALYAVDWVVRLRPARIYFEGAQILYAALDFKKVVLFLLFLTVLRQRRGYLYAGLAAVVALVPSLSSARSAFSGIFVLLLLAALSEWRPWARAADVRRRNRRVVAFTAVTAAVLLGLGLLWQEGVKQRWRRHLRASTTAAAPPLERVQEAAGAWRDAALDFNLSQAAVAVAARTSSGLGYFAAVSRNVPAAIPHTTGDLTVRGLAHLARPRLFFPDKENLGGDSWLVRRYARADVPGAEADTSIGLGYIAQAYIDFGPAGMLAALALLGAFVAACYRGLLPFAPSARWYQAAATILLVRQFSGYESELAKLTGGMVTKLVVFAVLLATFARGVDAMARIPAAPDPSGSPDSVSGGSEA